MSSTIRGNSGSNLSPSSNTGSGNLGPSSYMIGPGVVDLSQTSVSYTPMNALDNAIAGILFTLPFDISFNQIIYDAKNDFLPGTDAGFAFYDADLNIAFRFVFSSQAGGSGQPFLVNLPNLVTLKKGAYYLLSAARNHNTNIMSFALIDSDLKAILNKGTILTVVESTANFSAGFPDSLAGTMIDIGTHAYCIPAALFKRQ
jgi:hypothetical protein